MRAFNGVPPTSPTVSDHSLMHKDFEPYYVRVGDSWTKIDYSKEIRSTWMKPLQARPGDGPDRDPRHWYLDDLPPLMFIKEAPK